MGGTAIENAMEEEDKEVDRLIALCKKLNIAKKDIDQLTYDLYREIASRANKRGIGTQLADAIWHFGYENIKKRLENLKRSSK